jgi:hexokinase
METGERPILNEALESFQKELKVSPTLFLIFIIFLNSSRLVARAHRYRALISSAYLVIAVIVTQNEHFNLKHLVIKKYYYDIMLSKLN